MTIIPFGARVRVSFKREDEDAEGRPIGPVHVTDLAGAEGDPLVSEIAPGVFAQPFDYQPDWRLDCGWQTLQQARRVALSYGVTLEES